MDSKSFGKCVVNRFMTMTFSVEKESTQLAMPWLKTHNPISGYVGGDWISTTWLKENESKTLGHYKITDKYCKKELLEVLAVDFTPGFVLKLDNLGKSSFKEWSSLSAFTRSKYLYKVAKLIEECQQLFAVIESISAKKALSRVQSKDIPNLIKSFNYSASCAMILEKSKDWQPIGPVCLIGDKYSSPSLSMSLRISSLLAAGNSVIVLANAENCLSACFLAELCIKAGIPKNVFNVLPFEKKDIPSPLCSNFLFNGSRCDFNTTCLTASHNGTYDYLFHQRPTVIVYENSDLHAAAEGVLENFFFYNPQSEAGGCKVMVQQSVSERFLMILENAFSQVDIESIWPDSVLEFSKEKSKELSVCIEEANKIGKVFKLTNYKKPFILHIEPVILSSVETGFKLAHKELGGPVIVVVTFRTIKESLSMFNCDNTGSPVSIWTEILAIALEVSNKLKTGTIWINSQNVFDPSVPFFGLSSSRHCVVGGKEEFYSRLKLDESISVDGKCKVETDNIIVTDCADRANKSVTISKASKADLNLAVSSAVSSQPNWKIMSKKMKCDLLLKIAIHLEKKHEDFLALLSKSMLLGNNDAKDVCAEEIADSVRMLYHWASLCEIYDDETKDISENMKVMQMRCPLGVIGIYGMRTKPLLSFIGLVCPAILFGNTVVCVVDSLSPEPVLKMCEIFKACDVPKGVINVLFGFDLMPVMCDHQDIDAVWFTESDSFVPPPTKFTHSFSNIPDYFNYAVSLKSVMAGTLIKSVFLPSGGIFSN